MGFLGPANATVLTPNASETITFTEDLLDNPSHIVPVMVCDPVLCKQISDALIDRYGNRLSRTVNYPTVSRGTGTVRGSRPRRTTAMPTSSIW